MKLAESSWAPIDLAELIAGQSDRISPSLCLREDGIGLLYPGRTHTLAGEPESGKSWLALLTAAQVLEGGGAVVYVDFEDEASSVIDRLKSMGATQEALDRLSYVRPDEPLGAMAPEFHSRVEEFDPELVVIDGVTAAMANEGLSVISNDDAAAFNSLLARPLSLRGPAVLLLDHVTKNTQTRGRNPLGAGHKLAAVSGAAYTLTRDEPFGRGRDGKSLVVVAKDRLGEVRQHAQHARDAEVVAILKVSSAADDFTEVRLDAPGTVQVERARLERKKLEILHAMGDDTFGTKGELKKLVLGNGQMLSNAINELIAEGAISGTRPYERSRS